MTKCIVVKIVLTLQYKNRIRSAKCCSEAGSEEGIVFWFHWSGKSVDQIMYWICSQNKTILDGSGTYVSTACFGQHIGTHTHSGQKAHTSLSSTQLRWSHWLRRRQVSHTHKATDGSVHPSKTHSPQWSSNPFVQDTHSSLFHFIYIVIFHW